MLGEAILPILTECLVSSRGGGAAGGVEVSMEGGGVALHGSWHG